MLELALHVLDVLQNAVEAGATRVSLLVEEDWPAGWLIIQVSDNGRGMSAETVRHVTDPFVTSRTTRHVGLGLPLFAAAAERSGGELAVTSEPGQGTTVRARLGLAHPDRQPLGDMAGTLMAFLLSESAPDLHYVHRVIARRSAQESLRSGAMQNDCVFEFDTAEIRAELGGIPLGNAAVSRWLTEFLVEGEREIRDFEDMEKLEHA